MPLTEAEELELLELEEEEYQDSLLIAKSGKTEESPVPEKEEDEKTFLANRKPSQVAGDIAKGLTSSLTSGLPDVPYIAKTAWGAVKGVAGAAGNMFKKENYKNTINDPLGAAKGAAQGLGNTALGIGFGTLAEAPALRQMKYDRTGNPDIEYIPPKMLTPKTEGEKAGSNLASSAAILGATALSAKPIAKGMVKSLSSPELAKSVKGTANRLQNRTTKILSKEGDKGAKLENIGKHGLFGESDVALKKGKAIVDDAYTQLKNKIQENNSPDNYKNLDEALAFAEQEALSVTKEGRGAVVDAFKNIREDYFGSDKAPGLFKDKIIDLADAQMLKQDVGTRAEWHHLPYNAKADNAKGAAYKAIHKVLKETIEDAGGPEIKELNKKMSEVIPINTANAKRILVSQRSNPIPLDDFVGYLTSAASFAHGNPLPALLTVGNKIIKSPDFARRLYELGDKLEPPRIEPKYAIEKGTAVDLPSDWNIPAYQRKGIKPEIFTPITDKKRLLPAPMLDGEPLNIQKPIPSIGDRIRAIGQIKKDVPLVERLALPSPEDIKMQYPHFSKENIRKPIAPFNDRKALPAPMIGDLLQEIEKQVPTKGQRLERVGTEVKIFDRPATSGTPINSDLENFLSNKGLIEEALERMKNIPKSNLSKDQLERMKDITDYLTKNTGKAAK